MQNSPTRSVIDVGSIIDDTYTIEGLIGRGGMGAVFLATHRRLAGKKVAIKMLLADLGGDEILARFKREADIASTLDHPNIVKVENYNVLADGTPYIAYEFLQGESLAQRLAAGPLPLEQVFTIIRGVGSGLGAAHRAGIVHRDLKPQNIFLVQSEVAGHAIEMAKVLDFGISKLRGSQTVKTQESTLLGTPQYMAPEQATGQHSNVDERTDIFALGAIVYEMLTGLPAFSGVSIPEVVFKVVYEQPAPLDVPVPPNVAAAITRAMQKQASDRFPTVAAFVEALTGQPLAPPPRPTLPPRVSSEQHKKITANEAFAQTMGSDPGKHPMPELVGPTLAAPSVPPGVITNAPTISDKRSPALIVAIAIGGLAIAGAIIFVAVNHREPPAKPPIATTPTPPPPTPPPPTPQPAVVVDAAAIAVVPADAAPAPDAAIHKVVATAEPAVDHDADVESATNLATAERALRDKHYDDVYHLANHVLIAERASKRQRAQADMLVGIVACLGKNDLEQAVTKWRTLEGFPSLRKRLVATCQPAGFLTDKN
ncbi:MAG TPA: serine/threonine-protein kinase [Kofleriaceae bacterium]|jgi:serine/threonine-protein kinase